MYWFGRKKPNIVLLFLSGFYRNRQIIQRYQWNNWYERKWKCVGRCARQIDLKIECSQSFDWYLYWLHSKATCAFENTCHHRTIVCVCMSYISRILNSISISISILFISKLAHINCGHTHTHTLILLLSLWCVCWFSFDLISTLLLFPLDIVCVFVYLFILRVMHASLITLLQSIWFRNTHTFMYIYNMIVA